MFRRLLVTVGQNVEAGDPIGIAGGKDVLNFAIHTFSVSYNYDKPDSIKNADGTDRIIRWAFVPMVFLTTESKSTKLIPGKKYIGEYSKWKKTHE
jgi:murein DD-endopeptidase MepM/ murein hydrolase activator NlpD